MHSGPLLSVEFLFFTSSLIFLPPSYPYLLSDWISFSDHLLSEKSRGRQRQGSLILVFHASKDNKLIITRHGTHCTLESEKNIHSSKTSPDFNSMNNSIKWNQNYWKLSCLFYHCISKCAPIMEQNKICRSKNNNKIKQWSGNIPHYSPYPPGCSEWPVLGGPGSSVGQSPAPGRRGGTLVHWLVQSSISQSPVTRGSQHSLLSLRRHMATHANHARRKRLPNFQQGEGVKRCFCL